MEKYVLSISNAKNIEINEGTTFKEVIDRNYNEKNIILGELNGNYYELMDRINSSGVFNVIYSNSEIGWKVYSRTLQFIFIKASLELFPNAKIKIEHSISKGTFGELLKDTPINQNDIDRIKV